MKFRHAMIITMVLGIFAFNTQSEEYKAPKLKFKSPKTGQYDVAKEKDFRDFGENSYRVQENDYSDRNLASEDIEPESYESEDGRNPSSKAQSKPEAPEVKAESWQYNK